MKFKKRTNQSLYSLTLLLLTAQLFVQTAKSATEATLTGVGLPSSDTRTGINVSMAGGGDINASGYGFNSYPAANLPTLTTTLDGNTQAVRGTPLTEDDQFQSAPALGKLVYRNPSISELFNGLPLSDFERYSRVDFTISFEDGERAASLVCAEASRCLVRYNWDYTPLLYYMSPPVMVPGMIVTAAVNAMRTMDYKQGDVHAAEVRIDGEMLGYEGHFDVATVLGSNRMSRVSGVQESRVRDADVHPQVKFFGAGLAREWDLSARVCDAAATTTADCYTAKVLPTMAAIDFHAGSAEGGQLLTIDGTSLDATNTTYILVDGVQCIVQSRSESQVTCMTQYKNLASSACTEASPICDCSTGTCELFAGCNDPNNPVCTCTELDGVKTCAFAAACQAASDDSCQCHDITDPSTCWFKPTCKDPNNPACTCTDPYDENTCEFRPECEQAGNDYCVCEDLWNITTCKVKNCWDPANRACECTCSDPDDLGTCTDCAYKSACTDGSNTECYCHDLYDYTTCQALANCTDPDLGVCTHCDDSTDISTCQLSPACMDPVNQACRCEDYNNATTCAFANACNNGNPATDSICTCTVAGDVNSCSIEPTCQDPSLVGICECTDNNDPLTCKYTSECLDKMDLTCTCDDYADPASCSLTVIVAPEATPVCNDPNADACVCHKPNDASSCAYDPACLDDTDQTCTCTNLEIPSSCTVITSRYIIGQQGLVRTTWNDTGGVSIWNYPEQASYDTRQIWTIPEVAYYNYMIDSVEVLAGYFKVPITGRYRFLMSCDDNCALWLNRDLADPMSPKRSKAERLLYRSSHTSFRNLYPELRVQSTSDYGRMFSKWIDLKENDFHHFEVAVGQGGGDYHLSVGLEVLPDVMPAQHPNKEKQIQRFSVHQTIEQYDTSYIRVFGGDYEADVVKITMTGPDTNKTLVNSGELKINATAEEMREAIRPFYDEWFGMWPHVTKYYDNGNMTHVGDTITESFDNFDPAEHVIVYKIEVRTAFRAYGQLCTQSSMNIIGWTGATFNFTPSCDDEALWSDPPLAGQMYFTCCDAAACYSTTPVGVCAGSSTVQSAFESSCAFLHKKITVKSVYDTWSRGEMGCEYQINLWGLDESVLQFELKSFGDPAVPTINTDPIIGKNLVYSAHERRPFGSVLIWQSIPAEWFFTAHETPQVKMWVDDLPALCAGGNCDFSYEQRQPLITSYTLTGTSLSITGSNLPTAGFTVEMGFVPCVVDSASTDAQIDCVLDNGVPAGKWKPQVKDQHGLVKVDSAAGETDITATITSYSPSILNRAGGQLITVTGTNFPPRDDPRYSGYKFYLGASSDGTTLNDECVIKNFVSSTQFTCTTKAIVTTRRRNLQEGRTGAVLLPINPPDGPESVSDGPTVEEGRGDSPVIIIGPDNSIDPTVRKVKSVSESTLSPIGLQNVTICMADDYPKTDMCKESPPFTVKIEAIELEISHLNIVNEGNKTLNVIDCDDNTGCIKVKFGGGYSGSYEWRVDQNGVDGGSVDTSETPLQILVEVTDVQPTTSSVLGGAELTLKGGVFSEKMVENIVKVGDQWWDGVDHYCYVTEVVSPSEVRCRLPLDYQREEKAYTVIYFTSTYEEGNQNCGGAVCQHTFIPVEQMPLMTDVEAVFNDQTEKYELVFTGSEINGHNSVLEDIDVFIGGEKQPVISSSDTEVRVQVNSLKGGEGREAIDLFYPKGIARGMESYIGGVDFEPALVSVSAPEGSIAGSEIEATVPGIGVDDGERFTLVNMANNQVVCDSVRIEEYGKLKCNTTAGGDFEAGIELGIMDTTTGTVYDCKAANQAQCDYKTAAAGEEPVIKGVALSPDGTEMTFTGEKFPTSGFTCKAEYAGAVSTNCAINSDGEVVITWPNGAPTMDGDGVEPALYFVADDESVTNKASNEAPLLANPLLINSINNNSNLESSFMGGTLLKLDAPGLAEKVAIGDAVVRVCQQECVYSAADSSASTLACALPAIATIKSNQEFQITEEQALNSTLPEGQHVSNTRKIIGGADGNLVFDGSPLKAISGSTTCELGLIFADGYVGDLNELGIFMAYFDESLIVDNLKLQASNDQFVSDINDLVIIPSGIHEGWNYYDLKEANGGTTPKYNAYRLFNSVSGGCNNIGEIALIGYEVIDDTSDSKECDISVVYKDEDVERNALIMNPEKVIYKVDLTPVIFNVTNRYLDVEGGETITIKGKNLQGSGTEVVIDGVKCTNVQVNSDTELTCVTGARVGDGNCAMDRSSLDIFVTDKGKAVPKVTLKYVSLWSKSSTWGDLMAPIDGESVSVPKCRHLLVDIPETPKLYAVIVDGGSLIFPPDSNPEHVRKFHAHYVMVNNGLMEVGTIENPYCSKLIITMYGEKYDPAIPIYGKKVIGIRYSTLEMHGCPVYPCWTVLETTAQKDQNMIELSEIATWKAGDEILLPSTSFNMNEAEIHQIAAIDNSNGATSIITLVDNLKHTHYGEIENYGAEFIDLRGEVGLLTRSIIYRGDPEISQSKKFGAHIMVHSPGDETSVGKIMNVQLEDVGQAFLLGKYPIHFHMIGRVTKSYVKCNSVNRSYNRGTTIHGVHYLTVKDNVYHECMGHTLFVEDAAETKNLIEHNLVVNTRASHSLLDTDTTPGCFWITHPDNIFRNNHAAGCEKYGFWFDMQSHSTGPSFSNKICPINAKLGEFKGNVAHSVGRYGLRIFHDHVPRTKECSSVSDSNPEIPAIYEDFTGYKNNRSGIMGLRLGAVVFKNAKVADNKNSGIQFDHVVTSDPNANYLDGALVIGTSGNGGSTGHGIITPQTENWSVKNAHFWNFPTGAALGQCSHCFDTNMEDTDADTVRFSGLEFDDSTVPKRIAWTTYRKGIFHDEDGSLTGKGPNSWASTYWKHNDWTGNADFDAACEINNSTYDGFICDNRMPFRKILFYGPSGGSALGRPLFLWQWDEDYIAQMTDDERYIYYTHDTNATRIIYESKKNPEKHWTAPFIVPKNGNHTYYARWGYGHDFEGMKLERNSALWEDDDGEIIFIMPFYAIREAIYFTDNTGFKHVNQSIFNGDTSMCDNIVYNETFNETQPKNFTVRVNHNDPAIKRCDIKGIQCLNNCHDQIGDVGDDGPLGEPILWSNESSWPQLGNRLPYPGDDIVITTDQNMIMDIYETPILWGIEINGKLSCAEGKPCLIHTRNLWVRQGELEIGTKDKPFESTAIITLHGNNTQNYWAFTPQIDSGNKNLVVTGLANLYGKQRDTRTHLLVSAYKGNKTIQVVTGLDWDQGDEIALKVTAQEVFNSEHFFIEKYDPLTGVVTLTEEVEYFHYGDFDDDDAKDFGGLDMRSEVLMLSRNVKILASTEDISYSLKDAWGCRVLVADFYEKDWSYQAGNLYMDYVEIKNCSQRYTFKPALSWEIARGGASSVTNSAIHSGQGEGVHMIDARNIVFDNNDVFWFYQKGLKAEGSTNIQINNNRIGHVSPEWDYGWTFFKWIEFRGGAMAITDNFDLTVRNNVVFGANYHGIRYNAKLCDEAKPTTIMENNIVHSIAGYGYMAVPTNRVNGVGDCMEVSYLKGFKNWKATVQAAGGAKEMKCHDITSVDSGYGIACMGQPGGSVEIYDSWIYGAKGLKNINTEKCTTTMGIVQPLYGGNQNSIPKDPKWAKAMSGGGHHGTSKVHDIFFSGFESATNTCGGKQYATGSNPLHSDYSPMVLYENIEFHNTAEEAMVWMASPSPGWANPDDCGPFTCTGLYNTILKFDKTKSTGDPRSSSLPQRFQVIPWNKESISSQDIPTCIEKHSAWNGHICQDDHLGILLIDSRDPDRMTRNQQPLYVQNSALKVEPTYDNRLNAYMDHCWDGMYTCQTREQKFPSLVWQRQDYRVEYTGTPAQKQTVFLDGKQFTDAFMVTIWYPDAGAYTIYDKNQELVPPNDWDYEIETWAEIKGTKCGENRYEGVKNRLQFWITPGCTLFINPRDAIMLSIRLEWTMEAFFEDGGIGTFTSRMAAVLGIHAGDLKVVQAYEGSVIVVFQVFDPNDDITVLEAIKETFETVIPTIGMALGAPVMSFNNGESTTTMPGYEDLIEQEEDNLIENWFIDQVVGEDEDEEPKVQEVIKIEQIYVTKDEIDSSQFVLGVILVVSIILATVVITLLCVCIYRTFSHHGDQKLHSKIKEKMAATERGLTKSETFEDGDNKQYRPGMDDFIGNVAPGSQKPRPSTTPLPARYEDEESIHRVQTDGMQNSTIYLGADDSLSGGAKTSKTKVIDDVKTNRNESIEEGVTVGQSEYATSKGQFHSDKVDDMLMKSEQRNQMGSVDVKTKKGDPQNTVKPDETAGGGATSNRNLLGNDMNTPIDESPTKTRAISQQSKQRPQQSKIPPNSPYLQNQVIKGPSPRKGEAAKGSKQFL